VIYISAAAVELHCASCGERIVLEGPEVEFNDVAVVEQEHAYSHALRELEGNQC
jgi:hypothetical protein